MEGILHEAILNNDLELLRELLPICDVNAMDGIDTPLDYAIAQGGNPVIVKMLLDAGAALDIGCCGTPLHYAVCEGQLDTIRLLLEAGAEANAVNELGRNALFYIRQDNETYPAILQLLMDSVDRKGRSIAAKTLRMRE